MWNDGHDYDIGYLLLFAGQAVMGMCRWLNSEKKVMPATLWHAALVSKCGAKHDATSCLATL